MDFNNYPFPVIPPKKELNLPENWKCSNCGAVNKIEKKACTSCLNVRYPNGPIKVKEHAE